MTQKESRRAGEARAADGNGADPSASQYSRSYTQKQNDAARDAIRLMLRDSLPPDGEADYGPWAEVVAALVADLKRGGRDEAKTAFAALANDDPNLVTLMAEGPEPAEAKEPEEAFHLTDMGNAERLVRQHRDSIRYCHALKTWLVWDGSRWKSDDTDTIMMMAKQTVREIYREAADTDDDAERKALASHAKRSEAAIRLQAMITLAQSEEGIPIRPADLDADLWLLNCANGTMDLRTGELREHRRDDLITKSTGVIYDPDVRLPLWERFLAETTGGDRDLEAFLQRAVGYSLTGNVGEEVVFLIIGPEATGKSTFTESTKNTMGDYAKSALFETFLRRRDVGSPRPDIARLAGARLVTSVESEEGRRLASGLVKMLSGGDTVTTRFLYGHEFEFRPQFTLWLATNNEPNIRDDDGAMWRRVLRLPFERIVPPKKRDDTLKTRLCNPAIAGPAILAWAVQGCLAWQKSGLGIPKAVQSATAAYRAAMDPLADFFAECCGFEPDVWISTKQLRNAYERWADENGLGKKDIVNGRAWGERLRAVGCDSLQRGGTRQRGWLGIYLVENEVSERVMHHEA